MCPAVSVITFLLLEIFWSLIEVYYVHPIGQNPSDINHVHKGRHAGGFPSSLGIHNMARHIIICSAGGCDSGEDYGQSVEEVEPFAPLALKQPHTGKLVEISQWD